VEVEVMSEVQFGNTDLAIGRLIIPLVDISGGPVSNKERKKERREQIGAKEREKEKEEYMYHFFLSFFNLFHFPFFFLSFSFFLFAPDAIELVFCTFQEFQR
jgi:hypothetical protein